MSKIKSYTPQFEDYKNVAIPDLKIDATNPDNLSNKVLSEQESRKRILTHAKLNGCEKDMLLLFAKYDKMLRNCKNDKERQDMSKLACVETYRLLGGGGELVVNGQVVCKDNERFLIMSDDKELYFAEILWFSPSRGFGFAAWEKDGVKQSDIFCHFTDIKMDGFKTLYKGQKIQFNLGLNVRNDPKAVNIVVLKN